MAAMSEATIGIEIQRIKIDNKQVELNMEKLDLRKMEIVVELEKVETSRDGMIERISENEKRLKLLSAQLKRKTKE